MVCEKHWLYEIKKKAILKQIVNNDLFGIVLIVKRRQLYHLSFMYSQSTMLNFIYQLLQTIVFLY